ncbi:MAG: lipase maturation factor family protein [Bryobacteraceae bacterium]|jgi:predicted DCC family thiol-disulfide oxidoreductase YuxK
MPDLPLVIFDGHCSFCQIWVDFLRALTGDRFGWAPSQEVSADFPQIPREQFGKSVQLVLPDGTVESGARAVFHVIGSAPNYAWLPWCYRRVPGFAPATELAYRFIASRRDFGYRATRLLWGREIQPASFQLSEWIFLRLLALIYLIAFWSFAAQGVGLIGSHGILPLDRYLTAIHGAYGTSAWRIVPTLFWLNASDAAIQWLPIAGVVVALVALAGFAQRIALVVLFVLYLSVCAAGQEFLSFQWDYLLLEAGFLAIFLGPSRVVVWLFRLLLFRLMFFSGAVKLSSGDAAWHNLTALAFHYHTQPLPTPLAWYLDQLPLWFQRASTTMVLVVELAVPFLILLPRRARMFGAACFIALQGTILLTGNYAFFNWLAIALCILLLDDQFLRRVRPSRLSTRVPPKPRRTIKVMLAALSVLILLLNIGQFSRLLFGDAPGPLGDLLHTTEPLGIVNSYGLFAVMTTTRPEIVIQGSNDGTTWVDYSFRYKPGDLRRGLPLVAPHQPRLDWQMWFAALGGQYQNNDGQGNDWFLNLMVRLLQGSPEVTRLFERTPFGRTPPRYVRALLYEYRFTSLAERRVAGDLWRRDLRGLYFPAISLDSVRIK